MSYFMLGNDDVDGYDDLCQWIELSFNSKKSVLNELKYLHINLLDHFKVLTAIFTNI